MQYFTAKQVQHHQYLQLWHSLMFRHWRKCGILRVCCCNTWFHLQTNHFRTDLWSFFIFIFLFWAFHLFASWQLSQEQTLHKKGGFPLRISSVNVTKSADLLKKSLMINVIFCAVDVELLFYVSTVYWSGHSNEKNKILVK